MTNNFTAEEVLEQAGSVRRWGFPEAARMLTAYAALREQREAGGTAEPITHKFDPMTSESKPADSGRVGVSEAVFRAALQAWIDCKETDLPCRLLDAIRAALAAQGQSASPAGVPEGLIEALRHQRQVDEDGAECGVSRQAVDEAIGILERIAAPSTPEGDGGAE